MINTVIICKAAEERAHEFVETIKRKVLEAIEQHTQLPFPLTGHRNFFGDSVNPTALDIHSLSAALSAGYEKLMSLPRLTCSTRQLVVGVHPLSQDVISPPTDSSVGLVSGVRVTAGFSCAVFPIPGLSIPYWSSVMLRPTPECLRPPSHKRISSRTLRQRSTRHIPYNHDKSPALLRRLARPSATIALPILGLSDTGL
ncbi:hypothetical protein JCM11641_006984 [Rhodosporidiobolus odoratus]